MKSKILGLLAVGLLAGPMAAQAVSITSYDISYSRLSGYGGWSHNYSGTIAGNSYSGGSGTLNEGIVPNSTDNNHLFVVGDNSIITLYLSSATLVSAIDLFGGSTTNAVPGTLTGATIAIGGSSLPLTSLAFGGACPSGPCDDRFNLVGTGLDLIPTNAITISNFTGGINLGLPTNFYNIAEIQVMGRQAVPEPGTLALLGLGLLGLVASRMRKVS